MLLAAMLGVLSSASAAEKIYEVSGVIRESLDNAHRLRIAHEEIPGVMPAMTMAFKIADPIDAAGLKPGDRVRFKLHTGNSDWFATNFAVIGGEAAPSLSAQPRANNNASVRRVREGDAVPAFTLLDQDGAALTSAALQGKATVVTFIFTRCPVPEFCPAMALRFGELQKAILADSRLAARARLLSVTLDPDFDRPAILKNYGQTLGADFDIWRFVTGSREDIGALVKAFAVYTERNGVTLDHTLCTALVGPDGRVRHLWRGNGWKTEEALTALRDAL